VSAKSEAPFSPAETRAIAYRYLGRREYGCRELALKLERRGVDSSTAASVVQELDSEGLVSDIRFAEVFVRSKVARHFGPLKIRAQLRQRGIDESVIDPALEEYRENWPESALAWICKRAGEHLDRAEKARLYRSGTNRGFTHEQMMRALDRFQQES
jgi:regulatory protein